MSAMDQKDFNEIMRLTATVNLTDCATERDFYFWKLHDGSVEGLRRIVEQQPK